MIELIIDGCNGPIRFRQNILAAVETEDRSHDRDGKDTEKVSPRNTNHDDDKTILSFLRPESIKSGKMCPSSRPPKNKNGRKKKKNKHKIYSADTENFEESTDRLDMIPLLEKLLVPPTLGGREMEQNKKSLFSSISIIFDGISINKRPLIPVNNEKNNIAEGEKEAAEDDIVRGRFWRVTNDSNAETVVVASEEGLCNSIEEGSYLAIEVTGVYDEADNVIVERVQERRRRNIANERKEHSKVSVQDNVTNSKSSTKFTHIHVLRRTERGAGKNRRLFQPLGLLRPESVACVFEFGGALAKTADIDSDEDKSEEEKLYFCEHRHSRSTFHSSLRRLALDGDQTLRNVRRHNPGNVFLALDEPLKIPHSVDDNNSVPIAVPIVATDDVFLRQRIVHEGGYVMTFHQLWLLLMDVVPRTTNAFESYRTRNCQD